LGRYINCSGLKPCHEQENFALPQLPKALDQLPLSTIETCLQWLNEQGAGVRLLDHSWRVVATAYNLAVRLAVRGESLDPILTHRGGLLHDLAKLRLHRVEDHGAEAARLLIEWGQPKLAEIARLHMTSRMSAEFLVSASWEQKLVHLADKLIEGNLLVPLEERHLALEMRYPAAGNLFQNAHPGLLAIQQHICRILRTNPAELIATLTMDRPDQLF
jgi:hypothetical protein